jgi:UDPglucose 6-dehydrogenase
MKIAIIGAGYVGLVTAACLSEFGFDVTCVEREKRKIDQLLAGEVPFYEPGLAKIVTNNVEAGRLKFTGQISEAVPDASVVFIAVGTPTRRDSISADLTFVFDAAREIAQAMQGFTVITTKSTVPVGTAAKIRRLVSEAAPDKDFEVASNPEFLREGSAIEDFMEADRVVVGASGRTLARTDGANLSAARATRRRGGAYPVRGCRTDQVCRQCLPGHAHCLYQ